MYKKLQKITESSVFSKLLCILLLCSICYNIYLLYSIEPVGYKVNIYTQLPTIFWFLLIVIYTISSFQILSRPDDPYRNVYYFIIITNYLLFLILPYHLKYYNIGGIDDFSYLGEMISIANSATININDIYPATHVFFSITSLISAIGLYTLSTLLPILFSSMFCVGLILFSKRYIGGYFSTKINKNNRNNNLVYSLLVPISCIYYLRYMHFSIAPNGIFFMYIPIYLIVGYKYICGTDNSISYSILAVLLALITPYSHPFIILFIVYIAFLPILFKKYININRHNTNNIFVLLLVAAFLWIISNKFYLNAVGGYSHVSHSVGFEGYSMAQKAMQLVDLQKILKTIILLHGRYIIPTIIIGLASIKLFLSNIKQKNQDNITNHVFINCLGLYAVFGLIDAFLVFNPFITHTLTRLTTLNFVIFAEVPFFAISIYYLFLKNQTKNATIMASTILMIVFSLSIFGSLGSPSIYEPNPATTINQIEGMEWWLTYKNETMHITSPLNPQIGQRYADLLQGWNNSEPHSFVFPSHFGYQDNGCLMYNDLYISILGYDEVLYSSVYVYDKNDSQPAYTHDDFSRFRNDPCVSKIYDSLNIEIYKA